MWQNILVFAILALAGGLTLWKFYEKFTGKSSCCGGGCSCKGSCSSEGPTRVENTSVLGEKPETLSQSDCCCRR